MRLVPVLPAAVLVVVAIGCSAPIPLPTASLPTLQTGANPSPPRPHATSSQSPSAAVSHSPPTPSQDAIFRSVGEWVAANYAHRLTRETYLLSDLEDSHHWVTVLDREPELLGAGQPVWGDEMTDASSTVLTATLRPLVDLELVDDGLSVVNPEGFEVLGCRPYFGGRTMLRLGPPIPVREKFAVYVNVDRGCQGEDAMVFVEPGLSQFEVTSVIFEGTWTV